MHQNILNVAKFKLKWVQNEIPPSGQFHTHMLFDGRLWRGIRKDSIDCVTMYLRYEWG